MSTPIKFLTYDNNGRQILQAIVPKKTYATIDVGLLSTRTINLDAEPIDNSEMVHINGLLLEDNCYTIAGMSLVFDGALDIALGDFIDIRYIN